MADVQYDNLTIVGYHEPDQSLEMGPDGNKFGQALPGLYHVGVMLGGKFVQLASVKAGNYVDQDNTIQTGSADQQSEQPQSDQG